MSKSEILHNLYEECKSLNIGDTYSLIKCADSQEEKEFIRIITDFILQQRQKEVIKDKRF